METKSNYVIDLVSNSLKFTPRKGTIEVRIRYRGLVEPEAMPRIQYSNRGLPTIALRSRKPSDALDGASNAPKFSLQGMRFDFEVEDTGTGIPEHLQQEIFKPFIQGDLALSKKHGGIGLGLAICAQLAEMMGGTITVKSTVDIGSTFTLSLPLRYTKESVPSVSGSLARASAPASAPSLCSSIQFDKFSTRSRMSRDIRSAARSARGSVGSQDNRMSKRDAPRLIGLSQPYLVDTNLSAEEDDNISPLLDQNHHQESHTTHVRLEPIQSVSSPLEPVDRADFAPDSDHEAQYISGKKLKVPQRRSGPEPSALKVLVAEDNHINQQVILRLLKLENVSNITLAEDGEEALEIIRKSLPGPEGGSDDVQPFTLVLMDSECFLLLPRYRGTFVNVFTQSKCPKWMELKPPKGFENWDLKLRSSH